MKKLNSINDGKSMDHITSNIQKLQALFPDAFTEEKIDFEVLRQLLGDSIDERKEKYGP